MLKFAAIGQGSAFGGPESGREMEERGGEGGGAQEDTVGTEFASSTWTMIGPDGLGLPSRRATPLVAEAPLPLQSPENGVPALVWLP